MHVAVDNARASVRLIGALCAASEDVAAALGVVNGRGEAPLHRAAARGDVEAAAELLSSGSDQASQASRGGASVAREDKRVKDIPGTSLVAGFSGAGAGKL